MEITRRGFLKGVGGAVIALTVPIPLASLAKSVDPTPIVPVESAEWVWVQKDGYWVCDEASRVLLETAMKRSVFNDFVKEEASQLTVERAGHNKGELEPFRVVHVTPKPKITVEEYGRGIQGITKLPAKFDEEDVIQYHLIKQMTKVFNRICASALKSKAIRLNMPTIRKFAWPEQKWTAAERYLSMISVKPFEGAWYIGVGGTRFLRDVKTSSQCKWGKYLKEGDIPHLGDCGATGRIRWIECDDTFCFNNEAVVFGDGGLLKIIADKPTVRVQGDLISWYGVMGVGPHSPSVRMVGRQA